MARVEGACAYGAGLLRSGCGRPAVTDCVYCARPFCELHGERGEDYADVCRRPRCRRKAADLEAHREWRGQRAHANRARRCAGDDCPAPARYECARCRLLFCENHLRAQGERGPGLLDRMAAGRWLAGALVRSDRDPREVLPQSRATGPVCAHCAGRRRVWG